MDRKGLKRFSPLLPVVIFLLAIWGLNRALGEYLFSDILRQVADFPRPRIVRAVVLTAVCYGVLTLYDRLGVRYLGRRLPWRSITLASFISYGISRNVGLAVLTGGSVRYRFYSSWGLPPGDVARLIAFVAFSFTLGMGTAGGLILLLSGGLLNLPGLPPGIVRPIGALALTAVAGYLLMAARRSPPLRLRAWRLPFPSVRMAIGQMLLGSTDWALTAGVLYLLLPEPAAPTLPHFLQVYLFAQVAVIASHVPGGLGVFESMFLLLLPELSAPVLFGALLVYRGIYFLLPFALAVVLFGLFELRQRRLK